MEGRHLYWVCHPVQILPLICTEEFVPVQNEGYGLVQMSVFLVVKAMAGNHAHVKRGQICIA
jgi:hypothetical protein